MNFKDILLPLGLALLTTWAIQYFFFGDRSSNVVSDRSGQSFVAPETPLEYKPLNREIDFVDEKRTAKQELTTVETPLATYVFSSDGACLYRFDDKRTIDGKIKTLTTIFPLAEDEREHRCFMVGLNEKTPYFYKLLDRQEEGEVTILTYGSQSVHADANVTKKFIISKNTYRIVLEMTVEPKQTAMKTTHA